MDDKILDWLARRLAAHEGGAPNVEIGYNDATFDYVISQKRGLRGTNETLGCARSLRRAFELAMSGKVYDQ